MTEMRLPIAVLAALLFPMVLFVRLMTARDDTGKRKPGRGRAATDVRRDDHAAIAAGPKALEALSERIVGTAVRR
jgi:hypothetical protein